MKGILKIRNFDSLKKLNHKRAKGKSKYVRENVNLIHRTILTLERMKLLTPELLWDLLERQRFFTIEERKLDWVMKSRIKGNILYPEDIEKYVNLSANVTIPLMNVPYEIREKYKGFILGMDKNK